MLRFQNVATDIGGQEERVPHSKEILNTPLNTILTQNVPKTKKKSVVQKICMNMNMNMNPPPLDVALRSMDKLTDGGTVGRMDRQRDGGMDERTDGRMDGRTDRHTEGQRDGWTRPMPDLTTLLHELGHS
jgi:hypothetical protein